MITLPEQMLVANAEKKTVNPEKLTKGVQHDSDDDDGRMEMEMKREGPDYCIYESTCSVSHKNISDKCLSTSYLLYHKYIFSFWIFSFWR